MIYIFPDSRMCVIVKNGIFNRATSKNTSALINSIFIWPVTHENNIHSLSKWAPEMEKKKHFPQEMKYNIISYTAGILPAKRKLH